MTMSVYTDYLEQIEARKGQGLHPKPIEDAELVEALIAQIEDAGNEHREASLQFFIYNTLPGTTSAAGAKARFLKRIVLGDAVVEEITPTFALELLSHMKGGPSVEVLLDLALGDDAGIARQAADVLKTQVFLYEADTDRLKAAHGAGHALATEILESYVQAEFFTSLPEVDETIQVVTFVTAMGDVSTDLLSPGSDAHSRSDRELHGQCLFEHDKEKQDALRALQAQHPDKRIMLVAEKGTMGVGSSRMSGREQRRPLDRRSGEPLRPVHQHRPVVGGTNGISPIFLTTVGVTGGIGLDLNNWVKKAGRTASRSSTRRRARAGGGLLDRHGHRPDDQHQAPRSSTTRAAQRSSATSPRPSPRRSWSSSEGQGVLRRGLRQEAPDHRGGDPRGGEAGGVRRRPRRSPTRGRA